LLLQSLHTFRKSSSTQSQWWQRIDPYSCTSSNDPTNNPSARRRIYRQINKAICRFGNTRQITQRQAEMRDRRDYYTHLGSFIFFLSCPPPLSDCSSSYPRGMLSIGSWDEEEGRTATAGLGAKGGGAVTRAGGDGRKWRSFRGSLYSRSPTACACVPQRARREREKTTCRRRRVAPHTTTM
jgi:hypothetical protein